MEMQTYERRLAAVERELRQLNGSIAGLRVTATRTARLLEHLAAQLGVPLEPEPSPEPEPRPPSDAG